MNHNGFEKRNIYLPFLDHAAELVGGQVHAVEVGQDIPRLDIFGDELEFPEGAFCVGIFLDISKRYLKDTPFQTLGGDL